MKLCFIKSFKINKEVESSGNVSRETMNICVSVREELVSVGDQMSLKEEGKVITNSKAARKWGT